MSIYIPYFYIIRHIKSGKMYAGSRYAQGCSPDEFMKEDGYQTSSNTIKKNISEEGLNSFEILRIDTYCDGLHPYDYETLFLEVNGCARSEDWINTHNNMGMSYGLDKFKESSKNTKLIKYGDEKYNNSDKMIETKIEKYGEGFSSILNKIENTMLEKYGVKNAFQAEEVKEKIKGTNIERYGVEYPLQSIEISNKRKETCLKKYGVDNQNKTEEARIRQSNLAKSQYDNGNNKKLTDGFNKWWAGLSTLTCPHCGKESKSRPNMKRYHFNNCKKIKLL